MLKKEVIKDLFDCLTPLLITAGFKPDLRNQYFLKDTGNAIFYYDILFYDRTVIETGQKGFLVEPVANIHIKAIEAVYKQVTLNKYLTKPSHFITAGAALADLEANPDGIFKHLNQSYELLIFEEKDIALVCEVIKLKFEQIANPYFILHDNIASIAASLNKEPKKSTVHMNNPRYRIIKGLIASKISNDGNYNKLVEAYAKKIRKDDLSEDTKEEFQRVQAVLADMTF